MENLVSLIKKPIFLPPNSILPSASDVLVEMWVKPLSEFNTKYSGGIDCVLHSLHPLYLYHENFSKSTTRFSLTFVKTFIIMRVNKHFGGKFCTSVLFNKSMVIAAIFLTVDQLWCRVHSLVLANCAQKPKVLGSSVAASYVTR